MISERQGGEGKGARGGRKGGMRKHDQRWCLCPPACHAACPAAYLLIPKSGSTCQTLIPPFLPELQGGVRWGWQFTQRVGWGGVGRGSSSL